MVYRWHGAVVQIRSGGPDAIERRSLITFGRQRGISFGRVLCFSLGKPALVVIRAKLVGDAVKAPSIRADLVEWNDLVRIASLRAVGSMARAAVPGKQPRPGGQRVVDRQRILRRLQRKMYAEYRAKSASASSKALGGLRRAHHELHQRTDRAGVMAPPL